MTAPRRLLIVDDEASILFAMSDYFQLRGYAVDAASDPVQARHLLAAGCPDVAILDLRLDPEGHEPGLRLVELIAELCPQARILVLSAYASSAMEAEARRRGADLFLSKPQPLARLADEVARLASPPH